MKDKPLTQAWFPSNPEILEILQHIVSNSRAMGVVVGLLDVDGSQRVITHGEPGPGCLPLDRESVFEIGSLTKVFTGALLAEMVRSGEVELTTSISKLLPPEVIVPTRSGKAITLLDIATHHSGLPVMPSNFAHLNPDNPFADYTVEQMYAFLSGYELLRDPGEGFEYSNYATGLLGHALSLKAGKSYEALLTERILHPLGLTRTAITLSPWMEKHLVRGFDGFGIPVENWDIPTLAAAGALRSNVMDLLAFSAANLSPEEKRLSSIMRSTHQVRRQIDPDSNQNIGLNWIISEPGERTITWHNGGTGGYRTFLGMDLEASRAVVVLTNSGGYGVDDLGFHLLDPAVPLEQPHVGPVIAAVYRTAGMAVALERYESLRREQQVRFQFNADELTEVGYWLVGQEKIADAIKVLEFNVEMYPDAPSAYAGLGEGYRSGGRLEEAHNTYGRAVELAERSGDPGLSGFHETLASIAEQIDKPGAGAV